MNMKRRMKDTWYGITPIAPRMMFRCQTLSSMWTLGEDQPVIPRVTFIRWALRLPLERIGSLTSTFVPARVAALAVKHAYAFALSTRFPSASSIP